MGKKWIFVNFLLYFYRQTLNDTGKTDSPLEDISRILDADPEVKEVEIITFCSVLILNNIYFSVFTLEKRRCRPGWSWRVAAGEGMSRFNAIYTRAYHGVQWRIGSRKIKCGTQKYSRGHPGASGISGLSGSFCMVPIPSYIIYHL